jgi:hypothetical protein
MADLVVSVPRVADLGLSSTPNGTAVAGVNFSRTLTVTNQGPSIAQTTRVIMSLPPGMTLTLTSATGTCTVSMDSATCQLGNLASGASATITLSASVASAGTADVLASVDAVVSDPKIDNNLLHVITTITAPPSSSPPPKKKGGGGGGLDWLALGLLGVLLASRGWLPASARR